MLHTELPGETAPTVDLSHSTIIQEVWERLWVSLKPSALPGLCPFGRQCASPARGVLSTPRAIYARFEI